MIDYLLNPEQFNQMFDCKYYKKTIFLSAESNLIVYLK